LKRTSEEIVTINIWANNPRSHAIIYAGEPIAGKRIKSMSIITIFKPRIVDAGNRKFLLRCKKLLKIPSYARKGITRQKNLPYFMIKFNLDSSKPEINNLHRLGSKKNTARDIKRVTTVFTFKNGDLRILESEPIFFLCSCRKGIPAEGIAMKRMVPTIIGIAIEISRIS
jgi:hypothetical protein